MRKTNSLDAISLLLEKLVVHRPARGDPMV